MKARALLSLAALLIACACGGPGSLSGPVDGATLSVKDAAFAMIQSNGKSTALLLIMSDQPNVCDTAKANRQLKGETSLTFYFVDKNPDGTIIAPAVGEYTATNSLFDFTGKSFASVGFAKADSNCTNTLGSKGEAQSGLVKLTGLSARSGGTADGTFDITFGTQADKVTGSFSAQYCDLTSVPLNRNCE
jgi:hypothetical protein